MPIQNYYDKTAVTNPDPCNGRAQRDARTPEGAVSEKSDNFRDGAVLHTWMSTVRTSNDSWKQLQLWNSQREVVTLNTYSSAIIPKQ
jgi:hypothetical protein